MDTTKAIECLKQCMVFDDLYDITQKMDKKEKGDLFELIAYYLFKLCPTQNGELEDIWMYKNIPIQILKELKLPTKDKGIDLLAKINGEYCAVQCKFRQNYDKIIPWKELSTFFGLSFGINNRIKRGILVTNTTDLCEEVERSEKVDAIYGDFFDNLPDNFFENICNDLMKKKLDRYKKKEPLQHQTECIEKCKKYYTEPQDTEDCTDEDSSLANTRGYVEMACGTGKSLTAYWIDKILGNKRTIVFVPSLYLLSQIYKDWIDQSYAEKIKIRYILIGSDADIDEETKYKANGLMLHTNPMIIRQLIDQTDPRQKLVVISTYQSSIKLAESMGNEYVFDFAIFDEAHKTVGQVGKMFSMMLTDSKLKITKRLFMTATPKIYNGSSDDDDVLSMDDETYYGRQIYCYNTGCAVNDGRLVDYQLVTILATNKEIEQNIKENKLVRYKEEFSDEESNYLGTILMLLKKIHDGTATHMITYHNTVSRAIKFKDFLIQINKLLYPSISGSKNRNKNKDVYIDSMDGTSSMTRRKRIIGDYTRSELGILCSARVLNEGVNIPVVDSVCFVDSRNSTIDIIQCIGRSLRLCRGKKMASIFVPTFINSLDDEFDKNLYGNIIRILKALKSTDESVYEYFTMKNNGTVGVGGRKMCSVERFVEINQSEDIELDRWDGVIGSKIWTVVDPWESTFEKVKQWIDENNKRPVATSEDLLEKKLGQWISNQQKRYEKCTGSMTNSEKREKWKKFIQDNKSIMMTFDDKWYNKMKLLEQWIGENDRWPLSCAKSIGEKKISS
jgi:predicted helicase